MQSRIGAKITVIAPGTRCVCRYLSQHGMPRIPGIYGKRDAQRPQMYTQRDHDDAVHWTLCKEKGTATQISGLGAGHKSVNEVVCAILRALGYIATVKEMHVGTYVDTKGVRKQLKADGVALNGIANGGTHC